MGYPRGVSLALVLALFAASGPARAQVDAATRSSARILAEAGLALESAGDYAGALAKFERALALVEVPTLALLAARCLVRLGRLVDASERYRQARAMMVDPALPAGYRAAQIEAQGQAEVERAALMARMPMLEIILEGAQPADVELRIDAVLVPGASIGVERPIDPGLHRIEVRRGADSATGEATLAEGRHSRVVLKLPPRAAPPPRLVGPAPMAPQGPLAAPLQPEASPVQRNAGAVVIGLGGAGVVVGAITWGLAAGKRSDLDSACPNQTCRGSAPPALDAYNALRSATIASMVCGGVLVGAGVVTLATAPRAGANRPGTALAVAPWVGPALCGVRGSF